MRTVTFEPKRAKTWANSSATGPAPRIDQALGHAGQRPERRVIERLRLGESGDRGMGRSRAGRHDEPLALDPRLAVEQDGVVGVERGRAVKDVDARGPLRASSESPAAIASINLANAAHDGGEVDLGGPGVDAELAGPSDLAEQFRGLDEPLAGHAGAEAALAPGPPRSIRATFAPTRAADLATLKPPEPPPITTRSYIAGVSIHEPTGASPGAHAIGPRRR